MNELIRKKLNLLVHLAKLDGRFDQTEREVLKSMLTEAGIPESEYKQANEVKLSDFEKGVDKADILYWAIRMIKADGEIHQDELAFCKALAIKMGFNPGIIDFFLNETISSKEDFLKQLELHTNR